MEESREDCREEKDTDRRMDYREDSLEDRRYEIENRVRNLMWTVSGDYGLDTEPDTSSFQKSKYISLYDAIKQGAFSRYFDKDALGMYLVKKIYLGGEEAPLVQLAQLCVDSAVWKRISKERIGVPDIRRQAFSDILDHDFHKLTASLPGRVKLALLRGAVKGTLDGERQVTEAARMIQKLEDAKDTMELIRTTDQVYNQIVDKGFEKRCGALEDVLAVEKSKLKEFDWQDFLDEEMEEDQMERYLKQMADSLGDLEGKEKEDRKESLRGGVICLDEEAIAKMYSYIELNYGRSYLTPLEQEQLNRRICRGAHADCSLYFTDGILADMVKVNSQSEYARKAREFNLRTLHQNRRVTMRGIEVLTDILKHALTVRSEEESSLSEFGTIVPSRLWNVGRTSNRKLFERVQKCDSSEFAVDVLIDASGSQRNRQSQVALQAYIISCALSRIGLPHRVLGFCTFWDYTIMRRFREYDEGPEADERIFEFYGSSNNRDGLAVRAASWGLAQRPEENKILIILSDGRPNDIIVNRPGSRNPAPYYGDYAVKDTAVEVRKVRGMGISVLGVFAGEEEDLMAERRIFGKDFAYIRQIQNFSPVVGRYLKKQLTEE